MAVCERESSRSAERTLRGPSLPEPEGGPGLDDEGGPSVSLEEAQTFWKRWFRWATHSRLKPIREVAHLIKRHLANVLTYIMHPITNAVSEGLNSKIQTIKKRAYGFRNKDRFKIAIYFHCGGLNLYPA